MCALPKLMVKLLPPGHSNVIPHMYCFQLMHYEIADTLKYLKQSWGCKSPSQWQSPNIYVYIYIYIENWGQHLTGTCDISAKQNHSHRG